MCISRHYNWGRVVLDEQRHNKAPTKLRIVTIQVSEVMTGTLVITAICSESRITMEYFHLFTAMPNRNTSPFGNQELAGESLENKNKRGIKNKRGFTKARNIKRWPKCENKKGRSKDEKLGTKGDKVNRWYNFFLTIVFIFF